MSLADILELSCVGVGSISAILILGVGVLQGHYNFQNAMKFYNDASEDVKQIVGKPRKDKIYFQSIRNSPKFMCAALKNKYVNTAFTKYVESTEKEKGK